MQSEERFDMSDRAVGSTGNKATIRIYTSAGVPAPSLALHSNGTAIQYKPEGGTPVTITLTGAPTPNYVDRADGYYEVNVPDAAYTSAVPRLTIGGSLAGHVIIEAIHQVRPPYLTDKAGYSLAADQAVNVVKVGGTAVAGPDALKADVSALASQSSVDLLSGRIPDALEGGRIKAVATVSTAGLATEATQLAILAQTSLIGTGSVSIQSPVNQTGELQTLIVGDAYQLAAGRAITINVLNVAAGLQTILAAGATVHLGFRSFGKSRQSPDFRRYEFAGTIVSVASTTVVRFELTTNQTKGIIPGAYDYDIEFRQSGNYVTSVSNVEDVPMSWRESSTTLPA
jgi:hypothetical protein